MGQRGGRASCGSAQSTVLLFATFTLKREESADLQGGHLYPDIYFYCGTNTTHKKESDNQEMTS